jgi:hypothetical protein
MKPEKEKSFINTLGSESVSVAARARICLGGFEALGLIGGPLELFSYVFI